MLSSKLMFFRYLFIFSIILLFVTACKGNEPEPVKEPTAYKRFRGSYNSFNDMPELHLEAAINKGITPMTSRTDTAKHIARLVRIPDELHIYRTAKLTHSVPYLVEDASKLLIRIGFNFKDSLRNKKLPDYKLVLTSVTRTQEDVKSLTKRNINASENSVHCYGTTFDISWKRFDKLGPKGDDDISPEKLKLVLAEVLHDLRERGRCYIVHEKKQACFHITVR